jgi:hypothetical protein
VFTHAALLVNESTAYFEADTVLGPERPPRHYLPSEERGARYKGITVESGIDIYVLHVLNRKAATRHPLLNMRCGLSLQSIETLPYAVVVVSSFQQLLLSQKG